MVIEFTKYWYQDKPLKTVQELITNKTQEKPRRDMDGQNWRGLN